MYRFSYSEVIEDDPRTHRAVERQALEHSIDLLQKAEKTGPQSREAIDALLFSNRLWTVLIDDLGRSDNALPREMRANLISIGIFMIKQADQIRDGGSKDFRSMIDVSRTIADGLQ
jgi:flagellar protein FlaF